MAARIKPSCGKIALTSTLDHPVEPWFGLIKAHLGLKNHICMGVNVVRGNGAFVAKGSVLAVFGVMLPDCRKDGCESGSLLCHPPFPLCCAQAWGDNGKGFVRNDNGSIRIYFLPGGGVDGGGRKG